METNTDLVVLAEPFGLDDRPDILAKIRLQGGAQKISSCLTIARLKSHAAPLLGIWDIVVNRALGDHSWCIEHNYVIAT